MCLDVLDCARRQHSMCRMRVRAPYATTSGRPALAQRGCILARVGLWLYHARNPRTRVAGTSCDLRGEWRVVAPR